VCASCVGACVKRRASFAPFVELLSLVLVGGFRDISVEHSGCNNRRNAKRIELNFYIEIC
jgi:hypothetical protein